MALTDSADSATDQAEPSIAKVPPGGTIEIELTGPAAGHADAVPGETFVLYGARDHFRGSERKLPVADANGRYCLHDVQPGEVQWIGLDAKLFVRALVPVPAIQVGERVVARGRASRRCHGQDRQPRQVVEECP